MKSENFTTVEEYILSCPERFRDLLHDVRTIVLEAVPENTTETISYKMPTYKNKGNLFHFALFKTHLGLYPGSEAIEALEHDLKPYKTTKGAIQIPLDGKVPEKLIRDLIHFNVKLFKDKQGANWHLYRSNWSEAIQTMESVVNKTELTKEFKWGTDVYTFQNKNVIGWGGFKDFFSVWFYNGVFLEDKAKVLVSAQEGKTKSLRQWRFTDTDKIDEELMLSYILESIQTIKDGKEIPPDKPSKREATGLLKEWLENDDSLKSAFEALTPGKQKEYIDFIEEAKQEKTKIARLEKISPLILLGKSLHDKYKR
jgi:uncharacterized protein YdeI (YjbR/CyaY-like superfamily)